MSLKARLKRLEAQVDWLGTWGELIVAEQKLELIEKKKELADYLADHPQKAAILAAAGVTFIKPTPRPTPPPKPPPPEPPAPDPTPVESAPVEPAQTDPLPPAEPAPPQPLPLVRETHDVWETYDIPEHMQIRPIRWVPQHERFLYQEPEEEESEEEGDYDLFADL